MRGTSINIVLMLFGIHSVFIVFHSPQADYGGQLTGTPRRTKKRQCRITHTSGHDYLDAERASCLMNSHWNTVWSYRHHRALSLFSSLQRAVAVPVPHQIPRFQVWGSNPSQGKLFAVFSFSQLCATVNQWRIFFKELYRLINMSSHSKKLPWLGFRTPDLETWNLQRNWNCHSTRLTHAVERKRGKAPYECPIASHRVPMGVH